MAFRALMTMRQGKDEEIFAYFRRFDWVCTRWVGDLFNDDILMQFFMREFVKATTIRGVLQRNPRTLAEAKVAARDIKHIERDYEWLWRKEDELIPQFIPLLPKTGMDPIRPYNRPPYVAIEAASISLAVTPPNHISITGP